MLTYPSNPEKPSAEHTRVKYLRGKEIVAMPIEFIGVVLLISIY